MEFINRVSLIEMRLAKELGIRTPIRRLSGIGLKALFKVFPKSVLLVYLLRTLRILCCSEDDHLAAKWAAEKISDEG